MNIDIQILSFIVSFIFGICYYIEFLIYNFITKNKKIGSKLVTITILVINNIILYLSLMYKINNGYVHIYFIFMATFGYILSIYFCKNIVKFIRIS